MAMTLREFKEEIEDLSELMSIGCSDTNCQIERKYIL